MTKQTPRLAVGQVWRTRGGEEVTINYRDLDNPWYPFAATSRNRSRSKDYWYNADGGFYGGNGIDDHLNDLIELISPAPPTPRLFFSITRTDWTERESDECTFDAVADDGTAWWRHSYQTSWTQHPPLPDREVSHG